jgi:lipid II:glycine glycyltransferase (peptidoglycan interpeptide bridge formation enzyme)
MVFAFDNRSMHFWGGTSDLGRQKFASYLIQWAAIQWAIKRGCRYADLWGVPDEIGEMTARGEEIPKNRQGDLWGVYNFKRGFGANIEYYLGAYDYVYIRFPYWLITRFLYPVSERAALLLEKLGS